MHLPFSLLFALVYACDCHASSILERQAPPCTTSPAVPTPTTAYCRRQGKLTNPTLFNTFKVPQSNSQPEVICRNACLDSSSCQSFSYATTKRTCNLYYYTLKFQGFKLQKTGVYYWSRNCFTVTCPTSDCTPQPTQVVSNPSVEDNNGSPWQTAGDAARIEPATANDGTYAFIMKATETTTSTVSQDLPLLNVTYPYLLRFAYRLHENTLEQGDSIAQQFCQLDAFVNDGMVGSEYWYYDNPIDTAFKIAKFRVDLGAQSDSTAFNISFTLQCYNPGPGGVQVLVDTITLTDPGHNCRFIVQTSGGGSKVDTKYIQPSTGTFDSLKFIKSKPRAEVWVFDTQDNSILNEVTYERWAQFNGGADISVATDSYIEAVGFLSGAVCSIGSAGAISCSNQGNTAFRACGNPDNGVSIHLALTGNQTCQDYPFRMPISLKAIYI